MFQLASNFAFINFKVAIKICLTKEDNGLNQALETREETTRNSVKFTWVSYTFQAYFTTIYCP